MDLDEHNLCTNIMIMLVVVSVFVFVIFRLSEFCVGADCAHLRHMCVLLVSSILKTIYVRFYDREF